MAEMKLADTSVKYFHSGMADAPVLSGTPGALIAVLDACLVTGFGLKTVDRLVVADNIATAHISAGHAAEVGAVVLIEGATPAGLNGEQKVTVVTAGSVQFCTAGIADQTATGAMTLKMAAAGWAKAFSEVNLAAYKSTDVVATGCYLYVDDTAPATARVRGYEDMADIASGLGPFPAEVQQNGGLHWVKSTHADDTSRSWVLIADGRMLYFGKNPSKNYPLGMDISVFGDILSTKTSGDPYACIIQGQSQYDGDVSTKTNQYTCSVSSAANIYIPRGYTGLGASQVMRRTFMGLGHSSEGATSGDVSGAAPFPNQTDGGLYVVPLYLSENVTKAFRGISPGLYCCPQNVPAGIFSTGDSVTGIAGLPNRLLKVLSSSNPWVTVNISFVDITGPWR